MTTEVTAGKQLELAAAGDVQISRALLSVSDKAGIVDFARGLAELGIEIISTGGTAKTLGEAGIAVRSISDLTGFAEVMDGRVKTLHPKLYMSLLAVRSNPEHVAAAQSQDVEPVDMVCVNLYPFEQTVARHDATEDEVIENIDIGGPTMIRAAAKNFAFTAPVVSPASYDAVLDELRGSERRLSLSTRESLAAEAFTYTARYDIAVSRWFQERDAEFPQQMVRAYQLELELPYGENPHQRAAFYSQIGARRHVLSQVSQLGGKQLSYNNLLDLDAARNLLDEFTEPTCVIVKHNNPCGVASGSSALEAYQRAFACDPQSAYGGVIVFNQEVDKACAEALVDQFVEVLLARGYDEDALEVLSAKPKLRILDDQERRLVPPGRVLRQVNGGALIQDMDVSLEDREDMTVVTERQPSDQEWADMLCAWTVCKHVKSNAIVFVKDGATVGIGAGQMSRVDSVEIAVKKAKDAGCDLHGSAMASDAFFPFPDSVEIAVAAGATAIIQPGGSIRDDLSVQAADQAKATMVTTGHRHFRH